MSFSPSILIVIVTFMTKVHNFNALYVTATLNTCVHKTNVIYWTLSVQQKPHSTVVTVLNDAGGDSLREALV